MKGKLPSQNQRNLFRPILKEIVNPRHELIILAHRINWQMFEKDFNSLYSYTGQPGVPIRTMVGLLLLKNGKKSLCSWHRVVHKQLLIISGLQRRF